MARSKKLSSAANTKPRPFGFVLIPFDKSFDNIYQLGIVPACREAVHTARGWMSRFTTEAFWIASTTKSPRPTSS